MIPVRTCENNINVALTVNKTRAYKFMNLTHDREKLWPLCIR